MMADDFLTSRTSVVPDPYGLEAMCYPLASEAAPYPHAMRLNVCFIYYIQTVKDHRDDTNTSGVMRISHCIQIILASSDEYPAPSVPLLTVRPN